MPETRMLMKKVAEPQTLAEPVKKGVLVEGVDVEDRDRTRHRAPGRQARTRILEIVDVPSRAGVRSDSARVRRDRRAARRGNEGDGTARGLGVLEERLTPSVDEDRGVAVVHHLVME